MTDDMRVKLLYDSIAAGGRKGIADGGAVDELLAHPERDTRMGVGVLFRISSPVRGEITQKLQKLRNASPEIFYCNPDDFHVTVLELLCAKPGLTCSAALASQYEEVLRREAASIKPFAVRFEGFACSDGAILSKGYYAPELELLRQKMRAALRNNSLPLEERYETYSCHITVARFPCRIANPQVLLEEAAELDAVPLGDFEVGAIELVYHNWYDTKKEVLAEIKL